MFRGTGMADKKQQAMDAAIDNLIDSIIEEMNLSSVENWEADGRTALNDFRNQLDTVLRSPDDNAIPGLYVLNESIWREEPGIVYSVEILWDKPDFNNQREIFVSLSGISSTSPETMLEEYALRSEDAGSLYEAALLWAAIAGNAEIANDESGSYRALQEVIRILRKLQYSAEAAPNFVFVGVEPVGTIVFRVSANGKPVGNAQFIISSIAGKDIVLSDENGRITFKPPTALSSGTQIVNLNLDPDSFLQYLSSKSTDYAVEFAAYLADTGFSLEYEALFPDNAVATGVFILETDLAGYTLASDSTASGIIDNLKDAGFNVARMTAVTQEILEQGNEAFWNSIKNNDAILNHFERVIYGTVSLDHFEQDDDTFIVGVNGTLYLSDIRNQRTLYSSTIAKTSRAGDGQQAMNAAFRQLGRSFAAEILERTMPENSP